MTLAQAGATKYLPIAPGHSLPITDLELASIKASIKDLVRLAHRRDGEGKNLTISAVQHAVANAFGYPAGWGDFKAALEGPIKSFVAAEGLLHRADVLVVPPDFPYRLAYRQVADCLFEAGRPMPRRVFSGSDVDWYALLNTAATLDGLKVVELGPEGPSFDAPSVDLATVDELTPPARYAIVGVQGFLGYHDLAGCFGNLVGDQLCGPGLAGEEPSTVATVYESDDWGRLVAAGEILRSLLHASDKGWIEIVPFNEWLAFLKAPSGEYELVFRGMRDKPAPRAGKVAGNRDEQFEDWLYYEYKGWLELDQHQSEIAFYGEGKIPSGYTKPVAVLEQYLQKAERYAGINKAAYPRDGFEVAIVDGGEVSFSPLVTIGQFKRFMRWDREYSAQRSLIEGIEPWEPANLDDEDLPAAVTWHDANAYARWFRRTNALPVRLPTEQEMMSLGEDLVPATVTWPDLSSSREERLCLFCEPGGLALSGHPQRMSPEDFDRLELRYLEDGLPWATAGSGLRVVQSAYFAEWLEPKGAAINTRFFCCQYDVVSAHVDRAAASRGLYAPGSTGKYRGEKIGFRLVFANHPPRKAPRRQE